MILQHKKTIIEHKLRLIIRFWFFQTKKSPMGNYVTVSGFIVYYIFINILILFLLQDTLMMVTEVAETC